MRVAVVEDDPVTRFTLEGSLEDWGHEPVVAEDGQAAWEMLEAGEDARLWIIDWLMPRMDGIELVRKIREREMAGADKTLAARAHYIIMLTSKATKEDTVAGLDAGANDYIVKPCNSEELRARVNVGAQVAQLQNALADRVQELEEAAEHIKVLQDILPVCSHCHSVRNDQETWQRLDAYLEEHADTRISHSLCPECIKELYPEINMDEESN